MISVRRIHALVRKELFIYFRSSSLYIFSAFFLFFCSVWFFYIRGFFIMNRAEFDVYFSVFPSAFSLLLPALCMKSWVEEKKTGTNDILLSLPYSEWELVLGKYIPLLIQLFFILVLSLSVPLSICSLGDFSITSLITHYLGVLLLGAAVLSVGLCMSVLVETHVSAYLLSLFILFLLLSLHRINTAVELPSILAKTLNFVSLGYHYDLFMRSLLDFRSIAYYLLFICLFLFMTSKTMLFRRWD